MEQKLVKGKQVKGRLQTTSYLNDVFRHINALIVAWDKEQRVVIFNEVFVRMSGHAESEIIGQPLSALFPAENRSESLQKIEGASRKGGLVEIPILQKDGGARIGLWNISSIYDGDNGTPVITVAAGQDITERKRLDAQITHTQKMEAIGTLAGGLAHDFNNILQGISGYTQLLLMRKPPNDPDHDYLGQIEGLIQVATKLIEQLLIFGRKAEKRVRPLDLNREVAKIMKSLMRIIPRMISIETHLSDDLKRINVDQAQLEAVIMNLVANASDAMPDGGRLVIETKNTILDDWYCKDHAGTVPGRYVLLTVSDNGCGMDKETLERIFEPFYTTREISRGTGLGLAIVYGVIKDYKGYITCSSEPGQGTVFSVYFPGLEGVEKREDQPAEPEKATAVYGGNQTILVVDDEKPILEIACDILGQYGYTTLTAENGEDALHLYERERGRIDLILLDVGMPGMGGYQCFKELMRIDPAIKVIITTGYFASERVGEMLESGAAGFISKPYRLADMVKKVKDILGKR
ncbi:MAG: response regulator, partial [Deltaproteobacteria bacterium]|nr:response regulator [Deltaproteobacteria bacterium]